MAAEKLSDLSKGIALEKAKDQRRRRKIQKRELRRIVSFFIWANLAVGAAIVGLTVLEHLVPSSSRVITDKVIIAAIAGVTVQSGAIVLAAFKGLFGKK